jgi:hypothetical protein
MKFSKIAWSAALLLSFSAASAFAGSNAPMIQVETSPRGTAENGNSEKLTLVIGPEAYRHLTEGAHGAAQRNYVTLDLDVGLFTGFRASIIPYSSSNMSVSLEGFAGAAFISPAYGGGVRVQFRVAGGEKNALLISPGLDVIISPPDSSFLGHSGRMAFILANADIAWAHDCFGAFDFEIGMRLGAGLATGNDESPRFMPELELFTGLRF